MKKIEYSMIIETVENPQYFECQLFAYVTGMMGEGWPPNLGYEEMLLTKTQLGEKIYEFNSLIDERNGEPCNCIWQNGSFVLEIYFSTEPSPEMIKFIVKRIKKYCKLNKIKYIQAKIVKTITEIEIEEFLC